MRSKEIQKSLEKSTEKYFKESSNYRLPKTKNDIESTAALIFSLCQYRQESISQPAIQCHQSQHNQDKPITQLDSKPNNLRI